MAQNVAALRESDGAVTSDNESRVSAMVSELRDLELNKSRIEDQLKEVNIKIYDMLWSRLPSLMDECRVQEMTIKAKGNEPPYTVKVEDFYKANIPDEHREEAYAFLRKRKAEDLIKRQYVISFGLKESKAAKEFERLLNKAKVPFETKQGVPWNTLSAWFKVEYRRTPTLFSTATREILGATVGRVARIVKAKKES